ncbi:MAG: peptidoglycan-associated lipoprotein Pal [Nitrospirae bacterium]|nr:peptidoglycan-associated lipoprotein Pal [Nitrospirota bacterium]
MVLLGMVFLSGCGKKVTTTRISETMKPGTAEPARAGGGPVAVVSEPPVPRAEEPRESELRESGQKETPGKVAVKPPAAIRSGMVNDIYFDFDRYVIRTDARRVLDENAGILKGKPVKKVVIEGHCDERGTTDYNIALGERRAEVAKRYLTTLGVDASKISIISFGKEKPFCKEHNETCWQNNRRGHFIVTE